MLDIIDNKITSPVRQIKGKAELLSSSATAAFGKYVTFNDVIPTEKVKVKVASKNIANQEELVGKQCIKNDSGNFVLTMVDNSKRWSNSANVSIKANTTFTISFTLIENGIDLEKYKNTFGIQCFYEGDSYVTGTDSFITAVSGDRVKLKTLTLPKKVIKIAIYILPESAVNSYIEFNDFQIELGSAASAYTPYINPVGETITVGNQNLFNENKDYGNTIAVLEENGEKVFTHSYYDREGINREYVGFNITDIWQLAYDRGLRLTISFDIKAAIDGEVQVYTLGKMELSRINGNRFNNVTTEWQRLSYTAIPYYISNAENGEKCTLSFYGTYYTGCVPFVKNIQIEIGETVTDYVPYKSAEYTIDDTLTIEAIPYAPITTIYANNSGVFIEKAECKVCTCENTFSYNGDLTEITIERAGEESKFFGFGICQKANVKALDTKREKSITTDNYFRIGFTTGESYVNNFPFFYVSETHRDENTNAISVTAYDCIKDMEKRTVAELNLNSYNLREFAAAAGSLYGLSLEIVGVEDFTLFELEYESGANFEGTESIRSALNAVAEATQTIYYVTERNLVFKQLAKNAEAAHKITKADYIALQSKDNRRLQAICATNELGDATTASISALGTTQFVRDNPFLELREDLAQILDTAIAAVGGLTINQFTCSWRGNYLLEVGDKIDIETKDGDFVTSYVLNDTISYNGAFSENTQWSYTDSTETAANPTTLGEALKQTYARVDKANKQIDIVVSETNTNTGAISSLQSSLNGINASVTKFETQLGDNGDAIATLTEKVEAQITQDEVNLSIQKALENGVDKVETSTGFTFNEEGLTVSKSDSEISTTITEDGMAIRKGSKDMLTATNEGVKAEDLHATTFLIIGNNSRLESKGKRTYCYWIGG